MEVPLLEKKLDRAAMSVSFICILHCLLTPVFLVIFPLLGTRFLSHDNFHFWLLFLVIPTSALAIHANFRKNRNPSISFFILSGLSLLILTAYLGDQSLGYLGDRIMTIGGGCLLIVGHSLNIRQRRRCRA